MTVTRNGNSTDSGTVSENYIRLEQGFRPHMVQKVTLDKDWD